MPEKTEKKPPKEAIGSKERPWHPRFWSGITLRGWYSLLARNHFAIYPKRIGMALILCCLVGINVVFSTLQAIFFRRKIERTEITEDPIFVIGHWRCGTTMLHEMMVLDEQHTYADTYNCFAPNHFLASGWFFRPTLKILLPARRPMDNMAAGWCRPQEDEFALCNMGMRSPYLTLAFPCRPPQDQEYYELADISDEALAKWKHALMRFLKSLTVLTPKRIVLKSPTHTFRVKILLEMFPNAKFIHIVRNPYVLFPSTMKMWKSLCLGQTLQSTEYEDMEEHHLKVGRRMYEVFERDRHLIPEGHFSEVRYEDFIQDPVGQLQRIYGELNLTGFDAARPAMQQYVDDRKDYKPNEWEISEEIRSQVDQYWGAYVDKYYPDEKAAG